MDLLQRATSFAKEKISQFDAGHDWSHVSRVLTLSRKLREMEGDGDLEVIELSAVLHDIADTKFHEGSEEDGGDMAYSFLVESGFDPVKASMVRYIINNISYKHEIEKTVEKSIEFRIVQDADRLDAIGAIGIARAFNYGGYKNRALYDPDIPPSEYTNTSAYKKSTAPTINHFYEKLFKLKDLMNTESGRKIAKERHDYLVQFVDRFKEEWRGFL